MAFESRYFWKYLFLLSRYEEVVISERDNHDRFPAASIAFKEDLIEGPVVDEYVEVLWVCISQLWPSQKRKDMKPKRYVSCDVDYPFDCAVECVSKLLKALAGDVLKR